MKRFWIVFLTTFAAIAAFFLLLGIVLGVFAFIASVISNRIVACVVGGLWATFCLSLSYAIWDVCVRWQN